MNLTMPMAGHADADLILRRLRNLRWISRFGVARSAIAMVVAISIIIASCTSEDPTATPEPTATPLPLDVSFSMAADSVMAPLQVSFSADEADDDASYAWDFGDGNSASGPEVSHTYFDAGSFTVRLNVVKDGEASTSEEEVKVQPGVAGWITLETDSLSLESGEVHQFQINAYDDLGNPVSDPTLVWSAEQEAGAIDDQGRFVAGNDVGSWDRGVIVSFTRGGVSVEEKAAVEIKYSDLERIEVTPSEIQTRVTWGLDMEVTAFDAVGHVIEDADITWEALRPGDEIDQTGFFMPSETVSPDGSSLVLVRAEYEGQQLEQIVRGNVAHGVLDRVEVIGGPIELAPYESAQLSGTGFDRFGNELELDKIEWRVNDDNAGSISDDGIFTAGALAGEFPEDAIEARGFKDEVQTFEYVPVKVNPAAAVSIEFVYSGDSVPAGSGSPLVLRVFDGYGNSIDDVDVYVEVLGGGTLVQGNVFRAGLVEGDFKDAIVARILPGDAGNETLIEERSDVTVRRRSSDFLAVDIVDPNGSNVYLINLATAELVPLSAELASDGHSKTTPTWWPDGSRLAFAYDPDGESQLYSIDPFRNDLRQLSDIEGGALMPSISPDASMMAFVNTKEWNWQIYIGDLNAATDGDSPELMTAENARLISNKRENRHLLPAFSPDGNWILYTSVDPSGNPSAVVADPNAPFSSDGLEVRGAAGLGWHPDGQRILLSAQRSEPGKEPKNALALFDIATSELTELSTGDVGAVLGFLSPDGSEFAFVDDEEGTMWLSDIDESGMRQALGPQYQATIAAWRPRELVLPTPVDQDLGESSLRVPTGEISRERHESAEDGTGGPYTAVLTTDLGDVRIDLYNHLAPITVENFINLVDQGYYDGLAFHTVNADSAIFTGSIVDAFGGTAGYYIPSEYHPDALHDSAGVVSMLNQGENTGSTEFLIALQPKPEWDAFENGARKDCMSLSSICYAVFGKVVEGLDILMSFDPIDRFSQGDSPHRIIEARIERNLTSSNDEE